MVLVLADDIISFLYNIINKMNIDDFDGYHGYRLLYAFYSINCLKFIFMQCFSKFRPN